MKRNFIQIYLSCLLITGVCSCSENDITTQEIEQTVSVSQSRANVNTYYINKLTRYCEDEVKPYLSDLLDNMYREEYSIYYQLFLEYIEYKNRPLSWIGIDPTLDSESVYYPTDWIIFFRRTSDVGIAFPEEFLHHIQNYFYPDMGDYYQIDYEFEAKFSRDLCDQENNNGVCSLSGMGKNYPGDYSQWLDDIYYYNVYPYEPADFDKMYYFFLEDFVALGNTLGTYPGSPQYSEPLLGKTVLSYYGYWF